MARTDSPQFVLPDTSPERKAEAMRSTSPHTAPDEAGCPPVFAFLLVTLGASWAAALTIFWMVPDVGERPIVTQLFSTSLVYAMTMGWQPLLGLWVMRRCARAHPSASLEGKTVSLAPCAPYVLAIGLVALSGLFTWLLCLAVGSELPGLHGNVERHLPQEVPTWAAVASLLLALVATVSLLAVQTTVEEVGWRGFFLDCMRQSLGEDLGLWVHGVVWGLWYAPVVVIATQGHGGSGLARGAVAVLSCTLLGAILGKLRVATSSVAPAVTFNLTLTLAAGVPYVIHGLGAGLRAAVFSPPGWVATAVLCWVLVRWLRGGLPGAPRRTNAALG